MRHSITSTVLSSCSSTPTTTKLLSIFAIVRFTASGWPRVLHSSLSPHRKGIWESKSNCLCHLEFKTPTLSKTEYQLPGQCAWVRAFCMGRQNTRVDIFGSIDRRIFIWVSTDHVHHSLTFPWMLWSFLDYWGWEETLCWTCIWSGIFVLDLSSRYKKWWKYSNSFLTNVKYLGSHPNTLKSV